MKQDCNKIVSLLRMASWDRRKVALILLTDESSNEFTDKKRRNERTVNI